MSGENTSPIDLVNGFVNRADVLEFKAALQEMAKAESTDHARFTSPLDHAIARKAYWRHDAIEQVLLLLDRIVLSRPASLALREQQAMEWLLSSEAGALHVGEARRIVRERFGEDVEELLKRKFVASM
jgi:hypothetical protein